MKKKMICLIVMTVVITGCARTVTDKEVPGTELSIVINFAGTVDTFNNRYYILFPKDSTVADEFVPVTDGAPSYPLFSGPKRSMENASFQTALLNRFSDQTDMGTEPLAYFFSSYFVNWYDYLEIRDTNVYLYKGPFPVTGNAETNIDPSPVTQVSSLASNRISFTIDLSRLTHAYAKGDQVHFYVVTTTSEYQLADWMPTSIQGITNASGTILTGIDDDEAFGTYEGTYITYALNIQSWTLTIR